jgi:hypothetical protein
MKSLLEIGCDISREVEFLSSHFYEMKNGREIFKSLRSSMMSEVLSGPGLRIRSEDILYELIIGPIGDDYEFQSLLQFIRFEYLSTSQFIGFFDLIYESFHYLDYSIWVNARARFSYEHSPSIPSDRLLEPSPPPRRGTQFVPSSSSPLNGIISHLTRRNGGHVHTCGIVLTTSSSVTILYVAQNAADLELNSLFWTQNIPSS